MSQRREYIKAAVKTARKKAPAPSGTAFGPLGSLAPGTRIKRGYTGRITEDDPRWNPKTMGNRRKGGYGHR